MPYEGEIEVNNLPQGTTPNQADKIMLIDHETGELKQFGVASLSTVVSDVSFTNAAKNALIALLENVAYINGNGQQYLNELITNLAATVTSISAVFTQGANVIYSTDSLSELEQYLVVTATYSDGTSAVVSNYELSGLLDSATSTITVSYGGQTDTFNVSVTVVTLFSEKYVTNTSMYFADSSTKLVYYRSSGTENRISYLLDGTGSHAIPRANTSQTNQTIYPIPVPSTATEIITQFPKETIGSMLYAVKWNGSKWAFQKAGLINGKYGKGVYDISDINDGTLFIVIVIRNSDNTDAILTEDRTDWKFGWV